MKKKISLSLAVLYLLQVSAWAKQSKGDLFYTQNAGTSIAALDNSMPEADNSANKYDPRTGVNTSLSAGLWVPQGHLNILGPHPYLGGHFGGRTDKIVVGVTGMARFLKSQHTYQAFYGDSVHRDDVHLAYSLAFEAGRIFSFGKSHTVDLTGAAGVDGIVLQAYNRNEETENIGYVNKTLHSFNLQLGASYKFWTGKRNYIGLDVKYNFLFHNNKWGTDLRGNAVTIGIVAGGIWPRN